MRDRTLVRIIINGITYVVWATDEALEAMGERDDSYEILEAPDEPDE